MTFFLTFHLFPELENQKKCFKQLSLYLNKREFMILIYGIIQIFEKVQIAEG